MDRYWERLKKLCLMIMPVLLLAGLATGMGVSPRLPQIKIENQEARLSASMLGVGSVFMKIANSGSGDDALLSARAGIAGSVTEIHDVKDGKMVKRDRISIPAGGVVELKPRSLHIMVFRIPRDIAEGFEFTLHLTFEKSGEKQVPVKFVKSSDAGMHHNH